MKTNALDWNASSPQNPLDPLDDRNPTPEYRAPGSAVPTVRPIERGEPGWEGGSLVLDGPDPSQSVAATRQKFIDDLAADDANLRVMATALRLRGYTTTVIAKGLGVPPATIRRVLRQSREDGNLADIIKDLQFEALPLAIEKLIEKLEKGEWDAIKDTLKGLGAFRHYSQNDDQGTRDSKSLEVNFIMPAAPQVINPRGIVGAPRGQIVEGTIAGVSEATDGKPE